MKILFSVKVDLLIFFWNYVLLSGIYHPLCQFRVLIYLIFYPRLIFLIPSNDRDEITSIIPYMSILPLYFMSFEAKMNGEAPPNVEEIIAKLRERALEHDPTWGTIRITDMKDLL